MLEKENVAAKLQTGRNLGVLTLGRLLQNPVRCVALNCRTGKAAMEELRARENILFEICGKVIVAIEEKRVSAAGAARSPTAPPTASAANGSGPERLREIELALRGHCRRACARSGYRRLRPGCPPPGRDHRRPRQPRRSRLPAQLAISAATPDAAIVETTTAGEFAAKEVHQSAQVMYADCVTRLSGVRPASAASSRSAARSSATLKPAAHRSHLSCAGNLPLR